VVGVIRPIFFRRVYAVGGPPSGMAGHPRSNVAGVFADCSRRFGGEYDHWLLNMQCGRENHPVRLANGASRLLVLWFVAQRLGVNVTGVYRQLYRHCSEPLELMAPVDRSVWARAHETVHIYGGTRDGVRARAVCTHLYA
jgi:hypothetical protein